MSINLDKMKSNLSRLLDDIEKYKKVLNRSNTFETSYLQGLIKLVKKLENELTAAAVAVATSEETSDNSYNDIKMKHYKKYSLTSSIKMSDLLDSSEKLKQPEQQSQTLSPPTTTKTADNVKSICKLIKTNNTLQSFELKKNNELVLKTIQDFMDYLNQLQTDNYKITEKFIENLENYKNIIIEILITNQFIQYRDNNSTTYLDSFNFLQKNNDNTVKEIDGEVNSFLNEIKQLSIVS
jgi:hypothetical protein